MLLHSQFGVGLSFIVCPIASPIGIMLYPELFCQSLHRHRPESYPIARHELAVNDGETDGRGLGDPAHVVLDVHTAVCPCCGPLLPP